MSNTYFIIGANGQLGTALRAKYPDARFADSAELDITDAASVDAFDWSTTAVIINAAAYTNVDGAESTDGRVDAWNVNAAAVANLVRACEKHLMALVHISSDYVFDGTRSPHLEGEPLSPLSVYGASKAAGDLIAATLERHYIVRTTWVIGDGKNFVRTMLDLADKGVSPTVVSDQIGRLTFTSELVRAIDHLLETAVAYGTYNVTNSGEAGSWADVTRAIFELSGHSDLTVTDIATTEYYKDKEGIAPRPLLSEMSLQKLHQTGFTSRDWKDDLREYVTKETV